MKTHATPILLFFFILLSACGGGGSSSNTDVETQSASTNSSVDVEAPSILLIGSELIVHEYGDVFTDPGATATDNIDGAVEVRTTLPDFSQIGTYSVIYIAEDSAGNKSSVSRQVEVVDSVAPTITLIGEPEIVIKEGETFDDPGAVAMDNYEGALDVTISGYDLRQTGSQEITYTATDSSGNTASVVRSLLIEESTELFSLRVSWGAPETREDGTKLTTSEIAGYKVYMGLDDTDMQVVAETHESESLSTEISELAEGIYFISVSAFDINGLESPLSDALRIIL